MGTSDLSTKEPTTPTGRGWRRHSAEFKARVIELARRPGVSTAAVALANGLNANMLRRWVREAEECVLSSAHKDAAAVPAFVPERPGRRLRVFSNQVESPDDSENTVKQESGVPVLIQSKPNAL